VKRRLALTGILCLLIAVSLKSTLPALAEQQDTYQLVKSNIGSGGSAGNGAYSVSSSVGQPDVGQVSAGSYTLGGGFWGGGIIVSVGGGYNLYLPLAIK
jgi:uncharacterized membrane protein